MNNSILPEEVTSDKSFYEQFFGHGCIEEAEYKNPTLKKRGSIPTIPTILVKVIDITKMFDLTDYVSSMRKELQSLAKSRTGYANLRRKGLKQRLIKTQICIAYFRVDYTNNHPNDGRKKLRINDWFCTVYVNDVIAAGNLRGYQYFIGPLRKGKKQSISEYRAYVKENLSTSLDEFLIDLDVLVDIMVRFAPK